MAARGEERHQFQLDAEALAHYIRRPTEFIEHQLLNTKATGRTMTDEQKQLVRAVFASKFGFLKDSDGKRKFGVAARSGHGVGKTGGLAMLVLTWLYLFPEAKVPCTAPKKEQLTDNLWPEMSALLDMSLVKDDFEWQKTKVFIKGEEQTRFAIARTGSTQESLQGFHSPHLLFVGEEASGIPNEVFEPIEGALTNEGAVMLLVGNPTKASGYFHSAFKDRRFHHIHIPCIYPDGTMSRLVSPEYPERMAGRYGKTSNIYRIRVLGEFPASDPDVLIPWEWVYDASQREIPDDGTYRVVWGLDVARFGDDRTALCKRRGNKVLEPIRWWVKKDGMQIAGLLQLEYQDTPEEMRPAEIVVDTVGLGAGPYDRMRENGLPVRSLNASEAASIREKYHRRRDELWYLAREWFEQQTVSIPFDEDLMSELTTPKFEVRSNGVIQVESKKDFKKRLDANSPDLAEALILTFAGGLQKVEEHYIDRYKRKVRAAVRNWKAA